MINKIIRQVKANRKYKTISDEIVLEAVKEHLKSSQINLEQVTKQDIKEIREKLYRLYSSYQTKKKNKREKLLDKLEEKEEVTDELLSLVISTKERINDYKKIYSSIFEITGMPEIIADLGCGMNPLSFPLMNLKNIRYFAYDIDEEDMKFLNKYFEIMKPKGLNGKAEIFDVRNLEKISELHEADVVFMFKLIDLIDSKKKKISEDLIRLLLGKNIAKFIVVSFATQTLTGRTMNLPYRRGFELMLLRNRFKFKKFSTENEVFYAVWK